LGSILDQDYPTDRLEILVVDGESDDDSRERVLAFAETHPQVRLISNPRRIAPAAFNLGIVHARGDFIQILGAHTDYGSNYISACARPLIDGTADVAGGLMITVPRDDSTVAHMIQLALTHPFGVGQNDIRVASGGSRYVDVLGYAMFKRDVFEAVGLYDERFVRNQDNEMYARVRHSGRRVYLTVETECRYRSQRRVRDLLRTTYGNGLYHMATLRANPSSFRLRYFIPFFFVIALLGSAAGALFHWTGLAALALVGGGYTLAALLATAHLIATRGWHGFMFAMPALFGLIHFSYGWGTLMGISRFVLSRRWLKQPSSSVTLAPQTTQSS
jgi:glycosyltransferase involved in cell wall biosynthesis